MKSLFLGVIIFFCTIVNTCAQPYCYYEITNNSMNSESSLAEYNFHTGSSMILSDSIPSFEFTFDNTGKWVIICNGESILYNYNKSEEYDLGSNIIQFGTLIYSQIHNSVYIFSSYGDADTSMISSFTFDTKRFNEILPIQSIYRVENFNNKEAFLSSDENTIFFASEDHNYSYNSPERCRMKYLSTETNTITKNILLSTLGYPNSYYYLLHHGHQGVSVIESRRKKPDSPDEVLFRVYNFNTESGGAFIKANNWSAPYFTNNGKYLILSHITFNKTSHILYNNGTMDIYNSLTGQLLKTVSYPSQGEIYSYDDYPNNLYYFIQNGNSISSYVLNIDSLVQQSSGLNVKLSNSSGAKLPGGSLQYYEGGWKDAVNNGNGTFSVNTQQKTVSLRMTYAYGSQTKSNVTVSPDTVVFQTVNAQVKLQNSQGIALDTGKVQYYAGAWRDFGATSNGVAAKELLPNNYSFRMTYAYASNDKQQNIGNDPNVIFKTVNANVQLQNSLGALIDQGTVQYYAGAWREFGTTSNGAATKELLPNNYSFRMTYAYASNDKQQNIANDPNVIFKTVNANVQLQNSLGALIDQGTVQYYAGAWRDFGATSNGVATKELLPTNYSFRMTHDYISKDVSQNIGINNIVKFSTILCTIRTRDARNNPVDNAAVSYYAGAWRQIGPTVNGEITKELLPANLSFRAIYNSVQKDKTQDISLNNIIEFIL